jgi:hypothetical protein
VALRFPVKSSQIGIEMKLPGNAAFQRRRMSGPGGVCGCEEPILSIFRGLSLPNEHQDFFVTDHMNPGVLGWKDFSGRSPAVRAISGELAESKGATGQVIERLGEKFEIHDSIIWKGAGKGKDRSCDSGAAKSL